MLNDPEGTFLVKYVPLPDRSQNKLTDFDMQDALGVVMT